MSEAVKQQAAKNRAIYRWAILIVCLWLAFFLRVWGLDFGLPFEFHPDEYKYVDAALSWHTTGRIQLGFVNPPLFTYVLAAAFWMWFVVAPFTRSFDWITGAYVFARLWSVYFGLLTVVLIYPLGKRLYNCKAGVLAAILLTGLFLPAREAHFAVNDTVLTFFVLLAIYFSLELYRRNQWSGYVKAGMAVGFASAAKLTGGIVVISVMVAHILAVTHSANILGRKAFTWPGHRRLWVSLFVAIGTFTILSPYIVLDLSRFSEEISRHLQFGTEGYKGLRMSPSTGWEFYLDVLGWGMGWSMLVATIIALGRVFFSRRRQEIIVAVFAMTLFAYMGAREYSLPVFCYRLYRHWLSWWL